MRRNGKKWEEMGRNEEKYIHKVLKKKKKKKEKGMKKKFQIFPKNSQKKQKLPRNEVMTNR